MVIARSIQSFTFFDRSRAPVIALDQLRHVFRAKEVVASSKRRAEYLDLASCFVAVISSLFSAFMSFNDGTFEVYRENFPPIEDDSALYFIYEGCVHNLCSPYEKSDPAYPFVLAYFQRACFRAVYLGQSGEYSYLQSSLDSAGFSEAPLFFLDRAS